MKIVDERESQKEKKRTGGTEAKAKGWEINDFVERLGFLRLKCKVFLIFKELHWFEMFPSI